MSNPRWQRPNDDPALHPLAAPERSLVEQMGEIVDEVRQLATDLGARPYRVFAVTGRWSGGAPGRGTLHVVREVEFLPTPKIVETQGIRGEQRSGGLVERGSLQIRELSPRYTEDEIRGLCGCGARGADEAWIETRVDARDGSTERRRFVVSGMPFRNGERFEWRATLLRQDEDRTRTGAIAGIPGG